MRPRTFYPADKLRRVCLGTLYPLSEGSCALQCLESADSLTREMLWASVNAPDRAIEYIPIFNDLCAYMRAAGEDTSTLTALVKLLAAATTAHPPAVAPPSVSGLLQDSGRALAASRAKLRSATRTYVMSCAATGLLKIGRSANVAARQRALQTACGSPLVLLGVWSGDIERDLHARFADLRVTGEWFRDDGVIRAAVARWDDNGPALKPS